MFGVEGAARLDPLPLVSVDDRVGEDLARTAGPDSCSFATVVALRCLALAQPVELPLAQVDEDDAEHGDEDDQQCPADPQAAHSARLVARGIADSAAVRSAAARPYVPAMAPRPTATPTRNVVSGAATRSTSWAASRARSSRTCTASSSSVDVADLQLGSEVSQPLLEFHGRDAPGEGCLDGFA